MLVFVCGILLGQNNSNKNFGKASDKDLAIHIVRDNWLFVRRILQSTFLLQFQSPKSSF